MSFDPDNQRCEMSYGINCKDGDRPDWVPPDNCNSFGYLFRFANNTLFNMKTFSMF